MNPVKSKSRLGVEHYFSSRPLTHLANREEISAAVGEDCTRAIHNLASVGWLHSHRIKGQRSVVYQRHGAGKPPAKAAPAKKLRTAKLTTPVNGPGFTPAKPIGFISPSPYRITNCGQVATYKGTELQANPGITPDRMEAYRLPSIQGKWRVWPDGRRELLENHQ